MSSSAADLSQRSPPGTGAPRVIDEVLPGPYAEAPSPHTLAPTAATRSLVDAQVDALLSASPAFVQLGGGQQSALKDDMKKVAGYSAELVRDDFYQSLKIGQRPVLAQGANADAAGRPRGLARAQNDFEPRAANSVGRVTRDTLQALSFPTFVAELIRGTFQAIVNSSIQQMEAYGQLLANVSKTVDQFMAENISDNQARDYLAQRYPEHIRVRRQGETAVAAPVESDTERPAPNFRTDLGIESDVSLDEDSIEEVLVPAARRQLAQQRHRMLATMVLMGMNRIVVTSGRIRAEMKFHIDTSDYAAQQRATDLDARVAAAGSFGFGPWSASVSTSVAYVSSTRNQSESEMNVSADLTSEVDLKFKSDYFPLERFADAQGIRRIQDHTAVPAANTPPEGAVSAPAVAPPPPRRERARLSALPAMRPIGTMPAAPQPPTRPTAPEVRTNPAPDATAQPNPSPDAAAAPNPSPDAAANPNPANPNPANPNPNAPAVTHAWQSGVWA